MLKEAGFIITIIAFLMVLTIGGFFLKIVLIPWFGAQQLVETNYDIIDDTLEADNVIYNYEWFKLRKEAIDANYQKIKNAQIALDSYEKMLGSDRSTWTFEDKQEDNRLRSVVLGLENGTKEMIAEYNARSAMANRNIFKDGLIPDALEFESNLIK